MRHRSHSRAFRTEPAFAVVVSFEPVCKAAFLLSFCCGEAGRASAREREGGGRGGGEGESAGARGRDGRGGWQHHRHPTPTTAVPSPGPSACTYRVGARLHGVACADMPRNRRPIIPGAELCGFVVQAVLFDGPVPCAIELVWRDQIAYPRKDGAKRTPDGARLFNRLITTALGGCLIVTAVAAASGWEGRRVRHFVTTAAATATTATVTATTDTAAYPPPPPPFFVRPRVRVVHDQVHGHALAGLSLLPVRAQQ